MDDCIFCKIADGIIPAKGKTQSEDGSLMSFLDINPKAPGHTLVLPTAHTTWFIDMDDAEYLNLMAEVKKIATQLKQEYKADYVQVGIVGKDVPHVHVHLIPRRLSETNVL